MAVAKPGSWQKGKRRNTYSGDSVNYRPHGSDASHQVSSGTTFQGEFLFSNLQGEVKPSCNNGDSFALTAKHGVGLGALTYTFAKGDTLTGDYEDFILLGMACVTLKEQGITHTFP